MPHPYGADGTRDVNGDGREGNLETRDGMRPDSLSFADRLQVSFTQIGEYIPRFVGALALIFAGYLVARVLERITDRLLRRIRFNRILEVGGVMDAVERSGSHLNPTRVAGNLVFWTVMFAVLIVTANAAGF